MKPEKNHPCSCGSGKKYKHCCEGKVAFRSPMPSPAEVDPLIAMYKSGRYAELESRAHLLIGQYPDFATGWKLLGVSLHMQGKDSLPTLRRTAELFPGDVTVHNNLGNALKDCNQPKEAAASYRRALEIKPNFAGTNYNLGILQQELGQVNEALACCRRELKLDPYSAQAHNLLGNILNDLGQLDEALASYRRALKLNPDYAEARGNVLLSLNYSSKYSLEDCLEEACQYGRVVAKLAKARFAAWQCENEPKRLRVGIISGDLREHSVGHFLEGLLSHIDSTRIELIAYPTHYKEDELTARIRPYFSSWMSLVGKSDEVAARLIHADGVHVLLDLAGHTDKNRLPIFAWKPAPVQAMWLGYFATTGVAEMDYILGDKWTLPDGEEYHFVEKGWRLSGAHWCMTPPKEDIKVEELPALRNQSITFGTLNNLAKMNDRVVACWARILNEIPNSRLYLNRSNLRDDALRKSIIERYAAHGIAENRLILEATAGRVAALNSYNRIDIALDPFPYPGGTTSYEALWMGVPILTMRGSNYISHLGESIMHNAGLPDWIAANEEEYIAKAVSFSTNLVNLARLRNSLRARVLASPLFDTPLFARNFEAALWGMWKTWCDKQQKV